MQVMVLEGSERLRGACWLSPMHQTCQK